MIELMIYTNVDTNIPLFNKLRPIQNGRHFGDAIIKNTFWNVNVGIPFTIPLKFVSKGPISNIPALVQIMAWRRPGDKPISEPMMLNLPTPVCITRPQWVKLELKYDLYSRPIYGLKYLMIIMTQYFRYNVVNFGYVDTRTFDLVYVHGINQIKHQHVTSSGTSYDGRSYLDMASKQNHGM